MRQSFLLTLCYQSTDPDLRSLGLPRRDRWAWHCGEGSGWLLFPWVAASRFLWECASPAHVVTMPHLPGRLGPTGPGRQPKGPEDGGSPEDMPRAQPASYPVCEGFLRLAECWLLCQALTCVALLSITGLGDGVLAKLPGWVLGADPGVSPWVARHTSDCTGWGRACRRLPGRAQALDSKWL